METIRLTVREMKCEACEDHVRTALEGVDGVEDVTVSRDTESAEVRAGKEVGAHQLVSAVHGAGYVAEVAD